ncbi:hypothetical protein C1H46_006571 [Malus baccata]|uniref:Uncharacterized protein n=1 Tax=Malus baccata TaxID=106549 RepID=A0A540N9U2_MALBA|nr:hypothetical protein C1H46_006571 [Malus baccata]
MADLYSSTPSPAKREGQLQSPEQVALFEGFETLSRQISSRVNTNFPLIPFRKEEALRWVILWWSGIHHGPKMWFSGGNLRAVRSLLFSALLGPFHSEEDSVEKYNEYPGEALMKVCVKKPGLSLMLQFDCSVFEIISYGSVFNIHNAHCQKYQFLCCRVDFFAA